MLSPSGRLNRSRAKVILRINVAANIQQCVDCVIASFRSCEVQKSVAMIIARHFCS